MIRYLLDTNIVSEVVKPSPSPALLAWLEARDDRSLCIAALTLGEIWRGIMQLPEGKRRDALEAWFHGPSGPETLFAGRILALDAAAALIWGELMAEGKAAGRPRNAQDMVIAAVARANGCVMVTVNERDFWGVEMVNPCG